MVPFLTLMLSLVFVTPQFGHSSLETRFSQPLQNLTCWLCDVPRCQHCVSSQWTAWSLCSSPCGNKGYQSRTRVVHRPPSCINGSCQHLLNREWQPCNRFCHNGGSPSRWFCSCPVSYIGDCCETGLLFGLLVSSALIFHRQRFFFTCTPFKSPQKFIF